MKKFLKKLFIFVMMIPICLGFVSCNKSNNNSNNTQVEQNNIGQGSGEHGNDEHGNDEHGNDEHGNEGTDTGDAVTEITLSDFISQTESYTFNPTSNFSIDIQVSPESGNVKNYSEKIIYSEEVTDSGKIYTILASLSDGAKDVALMREYLVVNNEIGSKTLSGTIVDIDANLFHYTETFHLEDKDEVNNFSTYYYYKIMQVAICPYDLMYLFDGSFFQYFKDIYKLELNNNGVKVTKETTGKNENFTITCTKSETKMTKYTVCFNEHKLSEFYIEDKNNEETISYKISVVENNDEINFPSLDLMNPQTTLNMI